MLRRLPLQISYRQTVFQLGACAARPVPLTPQAAEWRFWGLYYGILTVNYSELFSIYVGIDIQQ